MSGNPSRLRLGTRGSELARTQSQQVAEVLTAVTGRAVELVIVTTRGDQVRDRPLAQVGGKGLFTKEIEDALLAREVDLAVHSMKDMPTESPGGLVIGAVPERADPRDALVGARLAELRQGAVVGTGSARRALQLRSARPDLEIRGIRGNVGTRIRKARDGEYDAVVLAMAGLQRLGWLHEVAEPIEVDLMTPAVGQGALAVQCREDDEVMLGLLSAIHHRQTAACVTAERAFLQAVSGGCSAPAACHARMIEGDLVATAVLAESEVNLPRRLELRADVLHAISLGRELARRLLG